MGGSINKNEYGFAAHFFKASQSLGFQYLINNLIKFAEFLVCLECS